jgi:hypothetical protein
MDHIATMHTIINHLLYLAEESIQVASIEPNHAFKIEIENGKQVARHQTAYAGLTINLTGKIGDRTRLYHLLDQNINAQVKLAMRGDMIYLYPVRETIPYTAPMPRYHV